MSERPVTSTSSRNFRAIKRNEDLGEYVFGKVPPQAIALEEAVLGAIMLDKDALPVVLDALSPQSFYKEAHQHTYKAMLDLFEDTQPIDLLTVTEALRKAGTLERVGGAYYLVELTNRVASAANIEYHARIIAQKHIQRELIRTSTNIIKNAYEDTTDVFDLLDQAERGLFDITQNNLSRSYETMSSISSKVLKQIEILRQKKDGLTGVPTGFTDIDRLTSGLQKSDLIILAARPGMGKTALTLSLAKNSAGIF
ncbi:MAG: DnaB-like helicase N-terminal domain-containing protein, partial [Bacteroidota bacterium]